MKVSPLHFHKVSKRRRKLKFLSTSLYVWPISIFLTPYYIADLNHPLAKYENVDPSKYAIDLNIYQVAYLHKILPGNQYRFQPEETAKKKIQSVKKTLLKKRNAKSNNTDSVVSNSDKQSYSERNVPDSISAQSKPVTSTPSKAHEVMKTEEPINKDYGKASQKDQKSENQIDHTSEVKSKGRESHFKLNSNI